MGDDRRRQIAEDGREQANNRRDLLDSARRKEPIRRTEEAQKAFHNKTLRKAPVEAVKDDKRPHCKAQPTRGRGSGGPKKNFVPWCEKRS